MCGGYGIKIEKSTSKLHISVKHSDKVFAGPIGTGTSIMPSSTSVKATFTLP